MINNGSTIITPSFSNITIPEGYHNGTGYVRAVDSSIDSNIKSSNIKAGVTILGVSGTLDYLDTSDATAYPTIIVEGYTAYINGQKATGTLPNRGNLTITPSSDNAQVFPWGYYSAITAMPVTSSIDQNIQAQNIKSGVTILGVTGILDDTGIDTSDANATAVDIIKDKTAYVNGSKVTGTIENRGSITIYPRTYTQNPDPGYYSSIYVNSVTSSIDQNIQAENIKQGVTILGVTGTLIPSDITPMDYDIYPSDSRLEYNDIYCSSLIIEKADARVDSNIQAQNIKKGVTILGVTGTLEPTGGVNYEAGTLTLLTGSYVNYNPIKQEGSMTVTEFNENDYCVATDGTYTYIRMYFSIVETQNLQIEFIKGSYSRFLFSILDSEMVRGTSNVTTNVYYDSDSESGNTVIYNNISEGNHYIDVKIISTDSSDVNSFKPVGVSIKQKIISQIYASLDAMNSDLSQSVGTYGFLYSIVDKNMISIYRFDGEKWVQKLTNDYTGTINPQQYEQDLDKLDELNGEIIGEE